MSDKHATVKAHVPGGAASLHATNGTPGRPKTAEEIRVELAEAWGDMGAAWGVTLRYAVQPRPEGIAQALLLSQASVEKHVTAIFRKLRIAPADTEHRRVRAVLTYLRADDRRR